MPEQTVLPPPGMRWQYRLITKVVGPTLFRSLGGWHVSGLEHVPDTGGALVCPNHVSYLDPPVVGIACSKRRCCFMARDTLFKIPLLGHFIAASYSYPVDREDGGRKALRIATDLLNGGEVVILFPEGTRSHTGELQQAKAGPAFIASRACVPVVPVAVWGTNLVMPVHSAGLHRAPIYVRFGAPLEPPEPPRGAKASKEVLVHFTERLMERVAGLQADLRAEVPARWRLHEQRLQARWQARIEQEQLATSRQAPRDEEEQEEL